MIIIYNPYLINKEKGLDKIIIIAINILSHLVLFNIISVIWNSIFLC